VLTATSRLYGADPAPPREALNALKLELYARIRELSLAIESLRDTAVLASVLETFGEDVVEHHMTAFATPAKGVEAFLNANKGALSRLRDDVGRHLETALDGFQERMEATVARTADWPADAAAAVRDAYDRFPFWDVLLYPIRRASATAELDRVDVRRLSPRETSLLHGPGGVRGPAKLAGVKAGHFGAFFTREAREADYLWGRLDGAEWLVGLLADGEPDAAVCGDAFRAVLDSERSRLSTIGPLLDDLSRQAGGLV
jgi:Protein of unknown function (DUF3376)